MVDVYHFWDVTLGMQGIDSTNMSVNNLNAVLLKMIRIIAINPWVVTRTPWQYQPSDAEALSRVFSGASPAPHRCATSSGPSASNGVDAMAAAAPAMAEDV